MAGMAVGASPRASRGLRAPPYFETQRDLQPQAMAPGTQLVSFPWEQDRPDSQKTRAYKKWSERGKTGCQVEMNTSSNHCPT